MVDLRDEKTISMFILFATTFLLINVSAEVGTIYSIFALIYFIMLMSKRAEVVEIFTTGEKLPWTLVVSFGMLFVWLFVSTFLISYISHLPFAVSGGEIFKYLKPETQIPILSSDLYVRIITYGVIIPVIETMFFLSFLLKNVWSRIFKIPVLWQRLKSPMFVKMIYVCALVGASGAIFHFSARLLSDYALIADFVFFFFSSLFVFKYKRLAEPMFFHMLVNLGVLLFG